MDCFNVETLVEKHLCTISTKNLPGMSELCKDVFYYEPIARLKLATLFSKKRSFEDSLYTLSTENQKRQFCNYVHSNTISLDSLCIQDLFDLLQLTLELSSLNRLKSKLGTEIERRLAQTELEELAQVSKSLHERGYKEILGWISFVLLQRKPTDNQIDQFGFSRELERIVMRSTVDDHHQQIFRDVLNHTKVRVFDFHLFLSYVSFL